MSNQQNSRIKVFHNLDELEEGQEIELTLDDFNILSNNRKLNETDVTLMNRQLYSNKYQKHMLNLTRTAEQRALDSNLQTSVQAHRFLPEYDTFDQIQDGFYIDDGKAKNEELLRIQKKLNLAKATKVDMTESENTNSHPKMVSNKFNIARRKNLQKNDVQKIYVDEDLPQIQAIPSKTLKPDTSQLDDIRMKLKNLKKANTQRLNNGIYSNFITSKRIDPKNEGGPNVFAAGEASDNEAVSFDEIEPEFNYQHKISKITSQTAKLSDLKAHHNGVKSILDIKLPSEQFKEYNHDLTDEEIKNDIEKLNSNSQAGIFPDIQQSAVGTLEYFKSKGLLAKKKSAFEQFNEEAIDNKKKKEKFKEAAWAFHKKKPSITKRIQKIKKLEKESKFARGGKLAKTLSAVQGLKKQPYTDISKLK